MARRIHYFVDSNNTKITLNAYEVTDAAWGNIAEYVHIEDTDVTFIGENLPFECEIPLNDPPGGKYVINNAHPAGYTGLIWYYPEGGDPSIVDSISGYTPDSMGLAIRIAPSGLATCRFIFSVSGLPGFYLGKIFEASFNANYSASDYHPVIDGEETSLIVSSLATTSGEFELTDSQFFNQFPDYVDWHEGSPPFDRTQVINPIVGTDGNDYSYSQYPWDPDAELAHMNAIKNTLNYLGSDILMKTSQNQFEQWSIHGADFVVQDAYKIELGNGVYFKFRSTRYLGVYNAADTLIDETPEIRFWKMESGVYQSIHYHCWLCYDRESDRYKLMSTFWSSHTEGGSYRAVLVNLYTFSEAVSNALNPNRSEREIKPSYENDTNEPGWAEGDIEEGLHPESEEITGPEAPIYTPVSSGFIKIWNPTEANLQAVATEMVTSAATTAIKQFFSNSPMDGIVSLHVVPYTVSSAESVPLTIAGYTFSTSLPVVNDNIYTIDCGTVHINQFYSNFLDFSPYTSAQLYLPFIGVQELNIDEIMNSDITLKYVCDCLSGDVVAYLIVQNYENGKTKTLLNSMMYQWQGSAIQKWPITGTDQSARVAGWIGAGASAAGLITAAATKASPALIVGSAVNAVESGINAVASSKPTFIHSGGISGVGGFLAKKTPYLIFKHQMPNKPANYPRQYGYPSNIRRKIAELPAGQYCEVDAIDITALPALDVEKAEIESILKGGFYK